MLAFELARNQGAVTITKPPRNREGIIEYL